MPVKGQVLKNPHTGDIYEFLETSKDTNGERVAIKFTLSSKGPQVPNHFHVLQDEEFEVISGKLTVWLDGRFQTISAGEKVMLRKGVKHNHFNNDDEPVVYTQTITPGLDLDYFIENIYGLTMDGKMKNGKAGLIQELVTVKYLDSKSYLADMPVLPQKILMNIVAPIARLFGYRAIYKKYSGIEK
jgi:quercetin dioxygenase-like cupin family protein